MLEKGYQLEETLRAYFMRSGFYVLRGVSYQIDSQDITDIDLWLYERPTGSSRRTQIVDIKYKARPKALERLIWTKGLTQALGVDDASVATTDTGPVAKIVAKKLGIQLLNGNDIKRIKKSNKILFDNRINEEELISKLKSIDNQRKNKDNLTNYLDLKASVLSGLGPNSLVRALEYFAVFSNNLVKSHPDSQAAEGVVRLVYFSASLVAANLDFISSSYSFASNEERRNVFINSIRYGAPNIVEGKQNISIALAIVSEHLENGAALSKKLEKNIDAVYDKIHAEVVADHVLRLGKGDMLFKIACEFEMLTYETKPAGFDFLKTHLKSFIGMLLDYSEINRKNFVTAYTSQPNETTSNSAPQEELFSEGDD